MAKTRLHLIGLFHTVPSQRFSHCAYTGKVLRFSKMMQALDYEVVEYSNEGSESLASEKVVILEGYEFEALFGGAKSTDFVGDKAFVGSPGYGIFDARLLKEIERRLGPRDIVCHPFGHCHERLVQRFPNNLHVETGIGYPRLMKGSFKIFESYAWMHYHMGKEQRGGSYYEWVVPNYFDLDEWVPSYEPGGYIAFLGRICKAKGMDTIHKIADHVGMRIVLCGQGDPSPWKHDNIEYRGPIAGRERSEFFRNAVCSLMPTQFVEPFGGSGVESMLCGTPLVSVDYGAFTETVQHGLSGYRCRTLGQWVDSVRASSELDRRKVAEYARGRYSLEACGEMYDRAFRQMLNLYGKGWSTL